MDRIIAPVSFARTRAPETFGFEQTRANVVSRSVLFNDGGGDIDIIRNRTLSALEKQDNFLGLKSYPPFFLI